MVLLAACVWEYNLGRRTSTRSGDVSVVSNPFPLIFQTTQDMRLSHIHVYIIPYWEYVRLGVLIVGGGDYEQPFKLTESVHGNAHVETPNPETKP